MNAAAILYSASAAINGEAHALIGVHMLPISRGLTQFSCLEEVHPPSRRSTKLLLNDAELHNCIMQHHLQQHVAEDCAHTRHQKMRQNFRKSCRMKLKKYRHINVFHVFEAPDILHHFHF